MESDPIAQSGGGASRRPRERDDAIHLLFLRQGGRVDGDGVPGGGTLDGVLGIPGDQGLGLFGRLWVGRQATETLNEPSPRSLPGIGDEEDLAAISLGASPGKMFWRVTLPNIKWGLLYGVILCNARAMGEFGAVAVVSGKIRGETTTMPLMIEMFYHEYLSVAAFSMAGVLALLALVTLTLKSALEWRYADQLAATHRH